MTQKANAFAGFTFEKPVVNTLKGGNHVVRINSYVGTDSFHLMDGTVKDGILEQIEAEEKWSDSTPQLAIVFVSTDPEDNGVLTYRFSRYGYKHADDFTEEELEDDKYIVIDNYVCKKNKKGKIVRIESAERTQKAKRFLNQFLLATQAKEGADLFEILDTCIEEKTEIGISVKKDTYNDRDVYDVEKFSAVEELVTKGEGIDSEF